VAPEEGERPRWSFTWLLRVQRTGRNRPPDGGDGPGRNFSRWFPWAVVLLLIVQVTVLVWLGVLPR
jgi:hypothetical protein